MLNISHAEEVARQLNISLRLPASHALDPSCRDLFIGWLSECKLSHERCQPDTASQELPTRLIHLSDTNGLQSARLVSTASLPPSTRYIALSYCWGPPSRDKPQLTTVLSNFNAHEQDIPLSSMPLTFQDLIALAKQLGLCYIWIDALCIIQDDDFDWQRESSRMFSVYRNAHLTVVSAGGPSCHSGFLQRAANLPSATIPFTSSLPQNNSVSGSYILCPLRDRRAWEADAPHHMFHTSWSTRGWTFQEDIMSRRVLYFTEHTAYFRCQTLRYQEQEPATPYSSVRLWMDRERHENSAYYYHLWQSLIITYAERQLTKQRDRLPALSGLARMFSQLLSDGYLAGLWRGQFARGLMWYVSSDARPTEEWRAPSWSWASCEGIIEMVPRIGQPLASRMTVHHVHLEPAGSDIHGMLRDGWLVVSGGMKPVRVKPSGEAAGATEFSGQIDVTSEDGDTVAQGRLDSVTPSGLGHDGSYRSAQTADVDKVVIVWAFMVGLLPPDTGVEGDGEGIRGWPETSCPAGLLLRPVGNLPDARPTYQKIGVFYRHDANQSGRRFWDRMPQAKIKIV